MFHRISWRKIEMFHRIPWENKLKCFIGFLGKKIFLKCFIGFLGKKIFCEMFQQIPWKKQARALSLILALISSLREAAGRRVVDVVVDGGDRVVVDELLLGSLSSSSLQIP